MMSRQRTNHAVGHIGPALAAAMLLAIATPASAQAPAGKQSCSLVQAGRLLDRPGHAARGASTLLVCNGRVDAVRDGFVDASAFPNATGATVIDLRDRFVLPGLIDSHVHLTSDKAGVEGQLEGISKGVADHAYEAAVCAQDVAGGLHHRAQPRRRGRRDACAA
jgi:hypothetical protein